MRILALDGALGPFSAALDLDGAVTSVRSDRNDALETGLGRIATLMAAAGIGFADLDRIAVGIGPGSFTGIRIVLSFAKSLAYGAGLPLVGIDSYAILTPPDAPRPCLTLVSGRRGIVCARRLDGDGTTTTACGPAAETIARLRPAGNERFALVVGAQDARAEVDNSMWLAPATAVAEPAIVLASLARDRVPAASLHSLAPDYGEMPAVTVPKARTVQSVSTE